MAVKPISVAEFANEVGVSTSTVWRALKVGGLASVRIGRAVRIPVTEIERVLSSGLRTWPEASSAKTSKQAA